MISPAPEWLVALCQPRHTRRTEVAVEPDLPVNVARAETWLAKREPAVAFQAGNDHTYRTAAKLLDMGLSPAMAYDMLLLQWNERNEPPWEPDELQTIVDHAADYLQNAAGAAGLLPPEERYPSFVEAPSTPSFKQSRFHLLDDDEMDAMPEPTYAVERMVPDQGVTLIYGQTGSFKSFIILDVLMSMAAGVPALGRLHTVQGPTVYCAGEAPYGVARKRRPAWLKERGIKGKIPFRLVKAVPLASDAEQIVELLEQIKAANIRPRVICFDTMARMMGALNENEAMAANQVIQAAEFLRDQLGCAVILLHHSGKNEDAGARGSSALPAGMDAIFQVTRTPETTAVLMRCEKMKDEDEPAPVYLLGHEVEKSLVFNVCSKDEHAAAAPASSILGEVGAALQALGAVDGKSVSTPVLAMEIEGPDASEKVLAATGRRLRRSALGRLSAYVVDRAAREVLWTFPVNVVV